MLVAVPMSALQWGRRISAAESPPCVLSGEAPTTGFNGAAASLRRRGVRCEAAGIG